MAGQTKARPSSAAGKELGEGIEKLQTNRMGSEELRRREERRKHMAILFFDQISGGEKNALATLRA
jgi:hypothetical protein